MKRIALLIACLVILSPTVQAQRRVITNDDIPAAPEPVAEPAPAQAQSAPAPASISADLPRTPAAELARLKAIQSTLNGLYDEFADKASANRSPDFTASWQEILNSMGAVIRANLAIIQGLEKELGLPVSTGAEPDSTQSAPPPTPPAPATPAPAGI